VSELSEADFYCPDCGFILSETSHLINKTGLVATLICGKCGSEFTIEVFFEKEPKLKRRSV
jgi:transcription elongation factor Elf1